MTLVQKEIKKIYVWKEPYTDYSAMRGPCPEGFHVPIDTEWQAIITTWTSLGGGSSAGTNFSNTLKLPFAGQRPGNTGNINAQGTLSRYRCSTYSTTDSTRAYYLYNDSANISVSTNVKYGGFSIRPFKDVPITPTNSWTKLYGTSIESGGIFWSITDGLISLSSDGSTWITISDKNLGATYAWNSGETLSQTNCGKYYQWGNNYGFPFTGSITTSSTQVNASEYGPGNYYSSSTFITGSYNWDSSNNNDLRGGETGIVQGGGDIQIRPITYAESITLDKSTIALTSAGQTQQLTATIKPKNATHKKALWSSSDTSIATVDSNGLVTCVTPGECVITASTFNGEASTTCNVVQKLTTTDITQSSYTTTQSTYGSYYGVKFTALKTGKINKVIFFRPNAVSTLCVLKITQGTYETGSGGTTYSLNTSNTTGGEFILGTPFEITAGQNYTVSFYNGSGNTWASVNSGVSFPYTGTAVRYDYSTIQGYNQQFTGQIYAIKGMEIEYE